MRDLSNLTKTYSDIKSDRYYYSGKSQKGGFNNGLGNAKDDETYFYLSKYRNAEDKGYLYPYDAYNKNWIIHISNKINSGGNVMFLKQWFLSKDGINWLNSGALLEPTLNKLKEQCDIKSFTYIYEKQNLNFSFRNDGSIGTLNKADISFSNDSIEPYIKHDRWNEAMSYFGNPNDQRIKLMLDYLCNKNDNFLNLRLNLRCEQTNKTDISMCELEPKYFIDKMENIKHKDAHYEWVSYIFYLAFDFQKNNGKISLDFKKLLLKFKNPETPTMYIIRGIYDKIARFGINPNDENEICNYRFITDHDKLDSMQNIKFIPAIDIFNLFLETNVKNYYELLCAVCYIDITNADKIEKIEYKFNLTGPDDCDKLLVRSHINDIINLIMILRDYDGSDKDTITNNRLTRKEAGNHNKHIYIDNIMKYCHELLNSNNVKVNETDVRSNGWIENIRKNLENGMNKLDNSPMLCLLKNILEIVYTTYNKNNRVNGVRDKEHSSIMCNIGGLFKNNVYDSLGDDLNYHNFELDIFLINIKNNDKQNNFLSILNKYNDEFTKSKQDIFDNKLCDFNNPSKDTSICNKKLLQEKRTGKNDRIEFTNDCFLKGFNYCSYLFNSEQISSNIKTIGHFNGFTLEFMDCLHILKNSTYENFIDIFSKFKLKNSIYKTLQTTKNTRLSAEQYIKTLGSVDLLYSGHVDSSIFNNNNHPSKEYLATYDSVQTSNFNLTSNFNKIAENNYEEVRQNLRGTLSIPSINSQQQYYDRVKLYYPDDMNDDNYYSIQHTCNLRRIYGISLFMKDIRSRGYIEYKHKCTFEKVVKKLYNQSNNELELLNKICYKRYGKNIDIKDIKDVYNYSVLNSTLLNISIECKNEKPQSNTVIDDSGFKQAKTSSYKTLKNIFNSYCNLSISNDMATLINNCTTLKTTVITAVAGARNNNAEVIAANAAFTASGTAATQAAVAAVVAAGASAASAVADAAAAAIDFAIPAITANGFGINIINNTELTLIANSVVFAAGLAVARAVAAANAANSVGGPNTLDILTKAKAVAERVFTTLGSPAFTAARAFLVPRDIIEVTNAIAAARTAAAVLDAAAPTTEAEIRAAVNSIVTEVAAAVTHNVSSASNDLFIHLQEIGPVLSGHSRSHLNKEIWEKLAIFIDNHINSIINVMDDVKKNEMHLNILNDLILFLNNYNIRKLYSDELTINNSIDYLNYDDPIIRGLFSRDPVSGQLRLPKDAENIDILQEYKEFVHTDPKVSYLRGDINWAADISTFLRGTGSLVIPTTFNFQNDPRAPPDNQLPENTVNNITNLIRLFIKNRTINEKLRISPNIINNRIVERDKNFIKNLIENLDNCMNDNMKNNIDRYIEILIAGIKAIKAIPSADNLEYTLKVLEIILSGNIIKDYKKPYILLKQQNDLLNRYMTTIYLYGDDTQINTHKKYMDEHIKKMDECKEIMHDYSEVIINVVSKLTEFHDNDYNILLGNPVVGAALTPAEQEVNRKFKRLNDIFKNIHDENNRQCKDTYTDLDAPIVPDATPFVPAGGENLMLNIAWQKFRRDAVNDEGINEALPDLLDGGNYENTYKNILRNKYQKIRTMNEIFTGINTSYATGGTASRIDINRRKRIVRDIAMFLESFTVIEAKIQILYNTATLDKLKLMDIDTNKDGINGTFNETIISYPTQLITPIIIDDLFIKEVNNNYISINKNINNRNTNPDDFKKLVDNITDYDLYECKKIQSQDIHPDIHYDSLVINIYNSAPVVIEEYIETVLNNNNLGSSIVNLERVRKSLSMIYDIIANKDSNILYIKNCIDILNAHSFGNYYDIITTGILYNMDIDIERFKNIPNTLYYVVMRALLKYSILLNIDKSLLSMTSYNNIGNCELAHIYKILSFRQVDGIKNFIKSLNKFIELPEPKIKEVIDSKVYDKLHLKAKIIYGYVSTNKFPMINTIDYIGEEINRNGIKDLINKCLHKMTNNIKDYKLLLSNFNKTTFDSLNLVKNNNYNYFCHISKEMKGLLTNPKTYNSECKSSININNNNYFTFKDIDTGKNEYYILSNADEPGGLKDINDCFEFDGTNGVNSKMEKIISMVFPDSGIGDVTNLPSNTNFNEFGYLLIVPDTFNMYNIHKKFIDLAKLSTIPYVKEIIKYSPNYNTRLNDYLKFYFKIIFDHSSKKIQFNKNLSKKTNQELFKNTTQRFLKLKKNIKPLNLITSSNAIELTRLEDRNQIVRKPPNLDLVMITNREKGNYVELEPLTDYFNDMLGKENLTTCNNTFFTGTNEECGQFFSECIRTSDTPEQNPMENFKKCKIWLTKPNFWNSVNDDIKQILPTRLLQILRSFGFDQKKLIINKEKVIVIKSVNEWLSKLKEETEKNPSVLTLEEYDKIKNNSKLCGYVEKLVNRVNSNLAILNKNYKGGHWNIKNDTLGIPENNGYTKRDNNSIMSGAILALSKYINKVPSVMVQLGGSNYDKYNKNINDVLQDVNKCHRGVFCLHGIFKSEFDGYIKKLKSHNKSLDPDSINSINDCIDKLKNAENQLDTAYLYLKKYTDRISLGLDEEEETFTIQGLGEIVDKYKERHIKVNKHQNYNMKIIDNLVASSNGVFGTALRINIKNQHKTKKPGTPQSVQTDSEPHDNVWDLP